MASQWRLGRRPLPAGRWRTVLRRVGRDARPVDPVPAERPEPTDGADGDPARSETDHRTLVPGQRNRRYRGRAPNRTRLIVCGDDPLALRLVEELVQRYDADITVIVTSSRRNRAPRIAQLPVRIVEADRLDGEAFRRAGVAGASAVALVQQDDVGNIHAALQAQELNPQVRLVIRMFNMSLGLGVRRLFRDCQVISDAAIAAPAFAAAALGEEAPVHVRLPGRTLYVARRADVRPAEVVCGLAARGPGDRLELLPLDQDRADLVLAVAKPGGPMRPVDAAQATGGEESGAARVGGPPRWRRRLRQPLRSPFAALRALASRKLVLAAVVLLVLMGVGTAILADTRGTSWWNAAYVALLDTIGGAEPDLDASPAQKVTEVLLSIVSIALIPVITAAVVEAVVNARLTMALGRLRRPISDHVVVVGLGNVGTQVMRQLDDLGVPVVAIDRSETARGVQIARERGIPFIVGDASRAETLRAASVQTCRALVVLSTDDVTNLEAALHGRALREGLRVVLRLFDGDFADRVQRAFGITLSRSVSYLAAPAFAAGLLERNVVGTIPVNRRVLLIAEVPVCPGSELVGAPLSRAHDGGARVIAVSPAGDRRIHWDVRPERRLAADDQLVVVATRAGLGRLLARTVAVPEGQQ